MQIVAFYIQTFVFLGEIRRLQSPVRFHVKLLLPHGRALLKRPKPNPSLKSSRNSVRTNAEADTSQPPGREFETLVNHLSVIAQISWRFPRIELEITVTFRRISRALKTAWPTFRSHLLSTGCNHFG